MPVNNATVVEAAVKTGLSAQRVWQDLREDYGFSRSYSSLKRFLRRIRHAHPEVADVLEHPPGAEAQVDYFQGPPTLDSGSGRWRQPWILKITLSCSCHSYEEPMWSPDRVSFLRALKHAFLDFGGVPSMGCRRASSRHTHTLRRSHSPVH